MHAPINRLSTIHAISVQLIMVHNHGMKSMPYIMNFVNVHHVGLKGDLYLHQQDDQHAQASPEVQSRSEKSNFIVQY